MNAEVEPTAREQFAENFVQVSQCANKQVKCKEKLHFKAQNS